MNANQINGTLWIFAGKIQERIGRVTRNNAQVLCGLQRQVLGAAEKRIGEYQQSARRTTAQRGSLNV